MHSQSSKLIPVVAAILSLTFQSTAQNSQKTRQQTKLAQSGSSNGSRTNSGSHQTTSAKPAGTVQPRNGTAIAPAHPTPIQPVQGRTIRPVNSTPVQPIHSTPVQPHQSQPVQPYQSQPVQPYQSQPVQPGPAHQTNGWQRGPENGRHPGGANGWRGGQADQHRRGDWDRPAQRPEHYDERRIPGRRDVIIIDRDHPGHHMIERHREYFVDHYGHHVYMERDARGFFVRRHMFLDGRDWEVDSLGRRIYVEQFGTLQRRFVVDEHGARWEYDIDDSGREIMVHRDFWGRIKERVYYPAAPPVMEETYTQDVPPGQDPEAYADQPSEPYPTQSTDGYGAQPVQPYQSQPIQPYESQPVQPYQSQPVQPYQNQQTQPPNNQQLVPNNSDGMSAPESGGGFFHTYGLAVPGVAYSYDNYATDTRTTVVSTGVVTKSAVRINPDGTYDWNSAWDGRMIHGNWTQQNGGILLLNGQEGKNWLLRTMARPSGQATVTLWDQNSIWYNGTPLN